MDPVLSKTRLKGPEAYLRGRDRTLLVVGYSASDKDVSGIVGNRSLPFNAEVISVGRGETGWSFSGLQGCFKNLSGFELGIPDHREFLRRLWLKIEPGTWTVRWAIFSFDGQSFP